jgi:hypothetical protein
MSAKPGKGIVAAKSKPPYASKKEEAIGLENFTKAMKSRIKKSPLGSVEVRVTENGKKGGIGGVTYNVVTTWPPSRLS